MGKKLLLYKELKFCKFFKKFSSSKKPVAAQEPFDNLQTSMSHNCCCYCGKEQISATERQVKLNSTENNPLKHNYYD